MNTALETESRYWFVDLRNEENIRNFDSLAFRVSDERRGLCAMADNPFSFENHPFSRECSKLVGVVSAPLTFSVSKTGMLSETLSIVQAQ
jgi:hypothetical protein